MNRIALTVASLALLGTAWAEVRTIHPTQYLARPPGQTFSFFGYGVAIDGGHIILMAGNEGGQQALLYRRDSNTGNWIYRRVLASVTGPAVLGKVRMKNGIAAVQFGDQVTIFEYSGGDYVRGRSASPIRHPGGLAISGNRILIGGDNCDYDAVVYQKGADGNWGITGRMDDNQGACKPEGVAVELNYDYALVRGPSTHQSSAWRRNGTALDWLPAGSLDIPPEIPVTQGPFALQKATAVGSSSIVFRNNGGTWTQQGRVVPVDYANGSGSAHDPVYRDGVLLTGEPDIYGFSHVYAYLETSPGQFEHVAILEVPPLLYTLFHDISGRSVVATARDFRSEQFQVVVFDLPSPLAVSRGIVNDFEDRDLSEFTFSGGQFALATRGTDDVLARTNTTGLGLALLNGSEWSHYQLIEADIAPTFSAADGWVGLVARYVDADNYYFVAIRSNNTVGIYRRLKGVNTLLREGTSAGPNPSHVRLIVDANGIAVWINTQYYTLATDRSLNRGRAGLASFQARADFDDVRASPTEELNLMLKDYAGQQGFDSGRPFTELGGNWQVVEENDGIFFGLAQLDVSGSALAVIGTPVENQEIVGVVRLDSYGSSRQGAWFGLLARYVDPLNYYYVTVRSTNQLQIRKLVNGVITVLASVNYTAPPGELREYRFRVIDNQLQLFVNGALVAAAHDNEITRGQYGIGTYRATATWNYISALQP